MQLDGKRVQEAIEKAATMEPMLFGGGEASRVLAKVPAFVSYVEIGKETLTKRKDAVGEDVATRASLATMFQVGFEAGYLYKESVGEGQ